MCDPVTATLAALAVTSNGLDMYKNFKEQNESVKQSNLRMQQSLRQAQLARDEAGSARQDGIEEARNKRLRAILDAGSAKTNIASGNLSVLSGTALNIFDTKKYYGDYEADDILKKANRASDSYLRKADEYYRDAELTSLTAKRNKKLFGIDMTAGGIKTLASVVGTINAGSSGSAAETGVMKL